MHVLVPQQEPSNVHVCPGCTNRMALAFGLTSGHPAINLEDFTALSLFVLITLWVGDVPHKHLPAQPCTPPRRCVCSGRCRRERRDGNAPGFGPGRCRNCLLGPSPLAPLLFIKPPSAKPGPSDGLVACTTLTPPETVWRSLLQPLDDHTSPGEDGPSANTRCGTPVTPISEAFVYASLHHTPTLLFSLHLCRRCTTPKKTLVFSHSFNSAF